MMWLDLFLQAFVTGLAWVAAAIVWIVVLVLAGWAALSVYARLPFRRRP